MIEKSGRQLSRIFSQHRENVSRIGDRISRNFEPWPEWLPARLSGQFSRFTFQSVYVVNWVDCEQSLFFFRFSEGSERNTRRDKRGRQPLPPSPLVTRVVVFLSRTTD